MIIEEENNNIQEISANDLYKKFDEWNKDKQNEIDKIGNKDKKKVNKLKEMNIRLNRMPTPIEGVELIDIKLGAKLAEDDIFLEEDFVAQYMRRGQSLFYDKNSDSYYYARIGLNKFFDYKKNFDDNNAKDKMQQKRVIGNLIKISEENKDNNNIKFLAYLTTKVNGENFQVSYNTKYSCWVIASKNVSMAVRNKEDINFYKNAHNFSNYINNNNEKEELLTKNEKKEKEKKDKKEKKKDKKRKKQDRIKRRKKGENKDQEEEEEEDDKENENVINDNKKDKKDEKKKEEILKRYMYATDFAETWLNILEQRITNKNLLEQFIAELGDHTLIGESVGDKKREHILVYKERDIIFYGIVNNKKLLTESCLPLSKSFELFKKYNLTYTDIQPSEKYTSLNDLLSYINIQYDVIFDRSLQESGEGNVVYFACEKDGVESIQNLGKLKTFEYRFLRKIREKCKAVPPNIDRNKIEIEEIRKFNQKRNKKEKRKNKEEKNENNEKEKEMINKNVDREMKVKNELREKTINKLKKRIINESKDLLKEVPQSKYNTDSVLQKKYFDFSEYIMNYRAMDDTKYFDVFASFIEIMKEKFEQKAEINEQMINEIKKKFEGLIDVDNNEEGEGDDGEEPKEDEKEEKKEEPKEDEKKE